MEWTPKHFIVLAIALLFIIKKALANKPFVKRYNNLLTLFIVIVLATFIAIEFWQQNDYIFYGSIVLAGLASYFVISEELKKRKK